MKGAPEQGKAGKKGGSPVNGSDMYKLKTTVQTLEASLSKKNKEIIELKKSRNDDDNSFQNLGNFLLLLLFFNIPIRKVFMKFLTFNFLVYQIQNCQRQNLFVGSLTPSKVFPLYDITEHKAIVCLVLPR